MSDGPVTDRATIQAMVDEHANWYHQIELAQDIVTPGSHPSKSDLANLDEMGLPADATGMRVLDIGCRDGFFSFEMERRGGEVIGLDYAEPHRTGFPIAAKIFASRVSYVVENVYHLNPETHGLFGVIYHLRNPLLALDHVRSVMKPGALLFVTSQIATTQALRDTPEPVWQFFPRDWLCGDASNKWAPNLPGLGKAIEECQFEVLRTAELQERAYASARAITSDWLEWHRRLDGSKGLW